LIYYQAKNLPGDKENQSVFLAIDVGQFSTKLTLLELATKANDPNDLKKGFYQTVKVLNDKVYFQFSGQLLDHCMANYSMKKHLQKLQENKDHTLQLNYSEFQRLISEIQKAKEILSANTSA
jgi:molecular chaperone DnaK (HSP70)